MPQLSIVAPTFNEVGNVGELSRRVAATPPDVGRELIFVDGDSPDGMAETLRALAQQNRRVRVMLRIGRRGLASACAEGTLAVSSPIVAVMDADSQHDESRLAEMFQLLRDEPTLDVVVASRHVDSGGVAGWDATCASTSRFATRLARLVLKSESAWRDLGNPRRK